MNEPAVPERGPTPQGPARASSPAPTTSGRDGVLSAALAYEKAGLAVTICRGTTAAPGKSPKAPVQDDWQIGNRTEAEIRKQWRPGRWVGLRSGDGLEGLDFDYRGILYAKWADLVEKTSPGLLARLYIESTPSTVSTCGHVFWRCSAAPIPATKSIVHTRRVSPTARLKDGTKDKWEVDDPYDGKTYAATKLSDGAFEYWPCAIERRGANGQTVVAPSRGYCVVQGSLLALPDIGANEREVLLNCALALDEKGAHEAARKTTQTARTDGTRPGDDFNLRGDEKVLLQDHGWQYAYSDSKGELWTRPGKRNGPSAHLFPPTDPSKGPTFYVFTSNGEPLEMGQSYSRFGLYAILEHGGDHRAAAKALGAQGYGKRTPSGNGDKPATDKPPATVPNPPLSVEDVSEPEWPAAPANEAYHGLAGEIVRTIGPHSESDPVALLVQLLVAFGSVIGRTAHACVEADRHFLNLYAVLVGETSRGRKGTSWGHVRRACEEVDGDWAAARVVSGLSSGEGLIWAVRDPVEALEAEKKGGERKLVVTDSGESDKRLLVVESEYANALKVMERQGNTLSPVVRLAWDTGNLRCLVKNNPNRATGAHISIIGHIGAQELRRRLSETESANGFGNRFLWVCVRRSKLLPEGGALAPLVMEDLHVRLREAVEFAKTQGELVRDEAARHEWARVYADLAAEPAGLAGALTARAEAQVLRLSCLYALLDKTGVVRPEHLAAAVALWRYCEASVLYVFGETLGDPTADEILMALRSNPAGLTRTEIHACFGRNKPTTEIDRALGLLLKLGKAHAVKAPTGGRPAERWAYGRGPTKETKETK